MKDSEATATGEPLSAAADPIGAVADWLMEQALENADFESLLEGCCARLMTAGVPLLRGHVAHGILHPLYASMSVTWHRDRGIETASYPHLGVGEAYSPAFTASPLYRLIETGAPFLRRRLTGTEARLDFPILAEFRDAGATDYAAYLLRFGEGELDGMVGSWTTDRPAGFDDWDIRALKRIQQRLGVACKMRVKDQIARNVVTTYLGGDAGLRVLNGQIRRGDVETIQAAVWYSDLRGSTALAESLPPADYIATLNDYFEAAGGAVLAHGGEILNFIGDTVLAVFPLRQDGMTAGEVCAQALAAGGEAERRLAETNAQRRLAGRSELSYGLGLHYGDVLFGNIGLPERLSFSIIGPTVNLVARLEALTKELNRPVLASEAFARQLSRPWEDLGEHALRGIAEPQKVLTPRD